MNQWVINPEETACMGDGDILRATASYGARDGAVQGIQMCFNNRNPKYALDPWDPNFNRDQPWHPWDNCYQPEALDGAALSAGTFTDCEKDAMQLFIKAEDDEALNTEASRPFPMRHEGLFLRASIESIFDDLAIFGTDILRVDFYVHRAGAADAEPQSFVLTPRDDHPAVCQAYEEADTINCDNFNVYCAAPSDEITLRVTGGGEFHMARFACGELLNDLHEYNGQNLAEMDYTAKWDLLLDDAKALEPTGKLIGSQEDREYGALNKV